MFKEKMSQTCQINPKFPVKMNFWVKGGSKGSVDTPFD